MANYDIHCTRCGAKLVHECNTDLLKAARRIYEYLPEGYNVDFKKLTGYKEGDENAPFFSEAFLYVLMGKTDARTILALVANLIRAAGLDPNNLERGINNG